EARGVGQREAEAEERGEGLADCHEGDGVSRESPGGWRRRDQVPDVAFVVVERGVEREGSAVEEDDPDEESEGGLSPRGPCGEGIETGSEEESEHGMGGHDRPLTRPQVQDVTEGLAGEDPIADPADHIERSCVVPAPRRGDGRVAHRRYLTECARDGATRDLPGGAGICRRYR